MSVVRAIGRWLFAAVLLLIGGPRRPQRDERTVPANRRAELWVAILLFLAGLGGLAFLGVYACGEGNTQLLGVAIALTLALIAAALILAGAAVVPQETVTEERPDFAVPEGERRDGESDRERQRRAERTALELREGVDGISRRKLLGAAGATAGVGLGAAALAPLASLGPKVGNLLDASPWRDGTPLVEENGMPVKAEDLEVGSYLTAFAEGADKRELATAVVVVRVRPEELELPEDRAEWAPEGLLAFSKICTHAQCAISLFRYPLYAERSPGPALVCPCHYSTFDVLKGGERVFGPAVRALPQLPLRIAGGRLLAAGDFSGPVGASWGRVREE